MVVADSGFSALDFLAAVSRYATVIIRLRLDAVLYAPAPPRQPGQKGRPRHKGKRLTALSGIVADPATVWHAVTVTHWYGEPTRQVDIVSGTAVCYHGGSSVVPIRWVLMRDLLGHFDPRAFLCTEQNTDPSQILDWFVLRWQAEVTFEAPRSLSSHPKTKDSKNSTCLRVSQNIQFDL